MMVQYTLFVHSVVRVIILSVLIIMLLTNNHAILTKDYKCGYCLKSKYWPVASSRPPFVSAQVSAIIPAVLLTGTSLRSVRKRSRVPITRDEVLDWENEN